MQSFELEVRIKNRNCENVGNIYSKGVETVSKKKEVLIIGGGAAGLIAAIACGQAGKKVMILEQKEKIGKKILATGNGKCNYTNLKQDETCYRSKNVRIAMEILSKFDVNETLSFFQGMGIFPKIKNGYCYPNSQQAISVVDAFEMKLDNLNIEVQCNRTVIEIIKKKTEFLIQCNEGVYSAEKVILATGGMASPKLGSDGSGYDIVKRLGHTVLTPMPALTALKCKETYFKKLAGVRTDGRVRLYLNNRLEAEDTGEVQLTAYGISGIPVFQVSRYAAQGLLQKKKVTIRLDFLPSVRLDDLVEEINRRFKRGSTYTAMQAMNGLLNSKLNAVLLKEVGIKLDERSNEVKEECLNKLAFLMKEIEVRVIDTNGFDNAQVTAGGIPLEEINSITMESRQVPKLYFCGEILDVDGICGGYNLQWAWSSGYLAGKGVVK